MSRHTSTPIYVKELPASKMNQLIEKGFKGYENRQLVTTDPEGIIMSPRYAEVANDIRNFEFRPDDIIVMTYPKSGTTWLLETLWAMRNIDQLELADKEPVSARTYFLDADGLYSLNQQFNMKSQMDRFHKECPGKDPKKGIVLQLSSASKTPRIIKTHLPLNLYPDTLLKICKIVYVCRDPRDICVSYYHHCRLINTYQFDGTFQQFVETFIDNDLYYGCYWNHVASAWQMKDHENIHIMFYEDLKRDPIGQLKLLHDFLALNLTEQQLIRVSEHSSFESMKARDKKAPMTFSSKTKASAGSFFRKGIVGDWENVTSDTTDALIQEWMKNGVKTVGNDFDRYN